MGGDEDFPAGSQFSRGGLLQLLNPPTHEETRKDLKSSARRVIQTRLDGTSDEASS
jgi:hypothetical protein